MRKKILLLAICTLIYANGRSQMKIGSSGQTSSGAMLELQSTNRGFLPPRINLTSLTMTLSGGVPADGMMVYSTNTATGVGLFVWHSSKWNKLVEISTTSYARFAARNVNAVNNQIQWEPVLLKQPEGLASMWQDSSPGTIWIRRSGLYIVSASYRKDDKADYGTIYIKVNNTNNIQESRYFNHFIDTVTPTYTILHYFQEGDIFSVNYITGGPNTTLGTTQLSISEIPLLTY